MSCNERDHMTIVKINKNYRLPNFFSGGPHLSTHSTGDCLHAGLTEIPTSELETVFKEVNHKSH